jgi:dCMP deaminase
MKEDAWEDIWLERLAHIATKSTCLRRNAAAILVKDGEVVARGYNGAPKGVKDCVERGRCWRGENIPSGEALHMCIGTHAEINAILQAGAQGIKTKGALMLINCQPCLDCLKAMVNAEIAEVRYTEAYNLDPALQPQWETIVEESDIILKYIPPPE